MCEIADDAGSGSNAINQEKINSSTRLLVATFTFKVLNRFGGSTMLRKIQEVYDVWPKQLPACATGKKYLGGSDRRTLERKRKTSGDDSEPSS